jgi:hypothetical protein
MLMVRMPTGKPGLDIALGWVVRIRGHDEIVWHGGGTPGYSGSRYCSPAITYGLEPEPNALFSPRSLVARCSIASKP